MRRVVIIGIGGIGGALLPHLTRFLAHTSPECRMILVDGDSFEPGNSARQAFERLGNKAEVVAARLRGEFPVLHIQAVTRYMTADNVAEYIGDDDVVLLCVDNHATRKLVSDWCEELDTVTLISGGNELTDGNVQIYARQSGRGLTLPLTNAFHPEIAQPQDRNPGERGCEQMQETAPQLLFTNVMIAAHMLAALYSVLQGHLDKDEVYVDILSGNSRAVSRHQQEKQEEA